MVKGPHLERWLWCKFFFSIQQWNACDHQANALLLSTNKFLRSEKSQQILVPDTTILDSKEDSKLRQAFFFEEIGSFDDVSSVPRCICCPWTALRSSASPANIARNHSVINKQCTRCSFL